MIFPRVIGRKEIDAQVDAALAPDGWSFSRIVAWLGILSLVAMALLYVATFWVLSQSRDRVACYSALIVENDVALRNGTPLRGKEYCPQPGPIERVLRGLLDFSAAAYKPIPIPVSSRVVAQVETGDEFVQAHVSFGSYPSK